MKKILFALIIALAFSVNSFAAVNINTATQAELESLNGIGPVKAKAIVDYRKKNGSFKSVDELEKVDGIGAGTLKTIRKDVSTSGQTTVVAPAKKPAASHAKASTTTSKAKTTAAKTTSKTSTSKTTTAKDSQTKDSTSKAAAKTQ